MATKQKQSGEKRKVLTPAERVAKLEADLAAARNRVFAKDRKQADKLKVEREKIAARHAKDGKRLEEIDAELADITDRIGGPVTDGVGDES